MTGVAKNEKRSCFSLEQMLLSSLNVLVRRGCVNLGPRLTTT